jgi:hypothetical protein
MRSLLLVALLALAGCMHARPEEQRARCPDSDRAACTSGGLQCAFDAKRSCDLCLCKFEVI